MAKKTKKVIFSGFDVTDRFDYMLEDGEYPTPSDMFSAAYRKAETIEEYQKLRAELIAHPEKYQEIIVPTQVAPETPEEHPRFMISHIDWIIESIKDPRLNAIMDG